MVLLDFPNKSRQRKSWHCLEPPKSVEKSRKNRKYFGAGGVGVRLAGLGSMRMAGENSGKKGGIGLVTSDRWSLE
jgi:hypothetical protein